MPHPRCRDDLQQRGHGHIPAHAAEVIADKVHNHDVLRNILPAPREFLGIAIDGNSPFNWRRPHRGAPAFQKQFGAQRGNGAVICCQEHRVPGAGAMDSREPPPGSLGTRRHWCPKLSGDARLVDLPGANGVQAAEDTPAMGVTVAGAPARGYGEFFSGVMVATMIRCSENVPSPIGVAVGEPFPVASPDHLVSGNAGGIHRGVGVRDKTKPNALAGIRSVRRRFIVVARRRENSRWGR